MKRIDYSSVNWNRHDAAIARDLGVTRAAVGKARRKAGAPASKAPKKPKVIPAKEWKKRAHALCERMVEWADQAEDPDDIAPEWISDLFNEAKILTGKEP